MLTVVDTSLLKPRVMESMSFGLSKSVIPQSKMDAKIELPLQRTMSNYHEAASRMSHKENSRHKDRKEQEDADNDEILLELPSFW